jgi:hypothetical protein
MAAALRSAGNDLERSGDGYDTGVLDADGAYALALSAVAEAFREIALKLQIHAESDPVRNEEAVEGVIRQPNIARTGDPESAREATDCGVVGSSQIHIPNIKHAEITLVLGKDGGDLLVKLPSIVT